MSSTQSSISLKTLAVIFASLMLVTGSPLAPLPQDTTAPTRWHTLEEANEIRQALGLELIPEHKLAKRDCPPLYAYEHEVKSTDPAFMGDKQAVEDPQWCGVENCPVTVSNSKTVSMSLDVGISGGPSANEIADAAIGKINGDAKLSFGFSWSKSTTATDTHGCTFTWGPQKAGQCGAHYFQPRLARAHIDIYHKGNICAGNERVFLKTVDMVAPAASPNDANEKDGVFSCEYVGKELCGK